MRKIYILVAVLVVIGAMAVSLMGSRSKSSQPPVACTMEAKICPDGSAVGRTGPNCEFAACPSVVSSGSASLDVVKVSSPLPGETVGKNFSLIGEARGSYFFEASFPVIILDKNGAVLVQTYATATSDWMTENFVPFTADISIPQTYSGPAKIILKKDNPSELPENDASMSFDVVIQ